MNDTLQHYTEQVKLALFDEVVAALRASIERVKEWHNMDGADDVWPIYWENAPEMRQIRETLARIDAIGVPK